MPVVLMLAYVAGCIALHGEPRFIYVSVTVAKLLGGVGLFAAALKYNRREYLFWAWAMLATNFVFLGGADLLFSKRWDLAHLDRDTAEKAWALFIVLSNVIAAVGTLMLARVWRVVGVALPDPTPAKRAAVIAGIVISVAIVGWVTIPEWKSMLKGEPTGFVGVVGSLSDIVCFSVIAPLVIRALAMRGGRLAWPWGLLAASAFGWVVFDVLIEFDLPVSELTARAVSNAARIGACLLSMAAGMAQRWAIRLDDA
jgi:hypothetical protein